MRRREVLLAMIGTVLTTAIAPAAEPADAWLRGVYGREIERHNKRLPGDNAAFDALFTREMRALMQAPRVAPAHEPIGPILHAMFGRGVLPGTPVTLRNIATIREGGMTTLNVALTVRDEARDLVVIAVRQDGGWHIHDIAYGADDTLAGHYRRMTGR